MCFFPSWVVWREFKKAQRGDGVHCYGRTYPEVCVHCSEPCAAPKLQAWPWSACWPWLMLVSRIVLLLVLDAPTTTQCLRVATRARRHFNKIKLRDITEKHQFEKVFPNSGWIYSEEVTPETYEKCDLVPGPCSGTFLGHPCVTLLQPFRDNSFSAPPPVLFPFFPFFFFCFGGVKKGRKRSRRDPPQPPKTKVCIGKMVLEKFRPPSMSKNKVYPEDVNPPPHTRQNYGRKTVEFALVLSFWGHTLSRFLCFFLPCMWGGGGGRGVTRAFLTTVWAEMITSLNSQNNCWCIRNVMYSKTNPLSEFNVLRVNKKRYSLRVAVTICKAKHILFQLKLFPVKIMQCRAILIPGVMFCDVRISGHTGRDPITISWKEGLFNQQSDSVKSFIEHFLSNWCSFWFERP